MGPSDHKSRPKKTSAKKAGAQKKKPTGAKKRRTTTSQTNGRIRYFLRLRQSFASRALLFSASLLLSLLLASLLYATFSWQPAAVEPAFVYEEPPERVVTAVTQHGLEDAVALVEEELLGGKKTPSVEPGQSQSHTLKQPFPSSLLLDELAARLQRLSPLAQLELIPGQAVLRLFWDNRLALELHYQPRLEPQLRQARIAIVMDDMGASVKRMEQILALSVPVTPAIIPGLSGVARSRQLLLRSGHEYLIHLPMQPRSYPQTNPGKNALLLGQSEETSRQLVRSYIAELPEAVGGNNHMGSRYTEDAAAMRIVLDELRQQNKFFIDSLTISSSVAFREARKMGVPTAARNIFLDNETELAYIRKQLRKMVAMALPDKEIIAICHPYAATIKALQLEQQWLQQQPVEFVLASAVVHQH